MFAALFLMGNITAQTQRRITVAELFSLLESGSKTLALQKTGVEVARRGVDKAKSKRLPDVDVSLSASYNGNVLMTDRNFSNAKGLSQPHFGNSFSLEAQQVVYAGGAVNAGITLAELQHRQSENTVDLTRNQHRFIAIGQYLDLSKISNGIRVYDSNISLTEKLIADIKTKNKQGMALKNDVTRYELQLEQLKLGKRRLEDQKTVLNHQLCNTLGLVDVEIEPALNIDKEGDENVSYRAEVSGADASSPQIRQTSIAMDMADQQLKLAKSELLPKVALFAADNFVGPFTYDVPPIDKNFNIWCVGVGVKYSLGSLFKANKSVRKAKEQVRQSREAHAVSLETVDNSVQQACIQHRQAFADLRTQQKSVELAAQNYNVISNRYENQLALVTDMIDASNVKLNAELNEVNAKINIAYTYYNIKYATGKLGEQ